MGKCCISTPLVTREDILARGLQDWKKKSMAAIVCKLSWNSAVYHLWRLRNAIRHRS